MALNPSLQATLSPSELFFVAEDHYIGIIPRQKLEKLDLVAAKIGPLRPPIQSQVPLWLALLLKKQNRARIVPPDWLSEHALRNKVEEEKALDTGFAKLPFRWLEISSALVNIASDDIPNSEDVRRLLRDLREVRLAKIREGMGLLNESHLQMDGLGAMEINEIRFIGLNIEWLSRFRPAYVGGEDGSEAGIDDA